MAASLIFKNGDPVSLNNTPGSAVAAGGVLLVGNSPLIAHQACEASVEGAFYSGRGRYTVTQQRSGGTLAAVVAGNKLFWNSTTGTFTTTSASGLYEAGVAATAAAGVAADTDQTFELIHAPTGTVVA